MKKTLNPFENAKRIANGAGGGVSPTVIEEIQEEITDIKAQLTELAGAYSTTEHKTGRKWIDGKDIYERTIELAITSLEDSSTVVAANLDYVDVLVDSNFTVQKANIKGCERGCAYISPDNELKLHVIERWGDIVTSQITIQYTKTGA